VLVAEPDNEADGASLDWLKGSLFSEEQLETFTQPLNYEEIFAPQRAGQFRLALLYRARNYWSMVRLVEPTRNRYNERAWLVEPVLFDGRIEVDIDEIGGETFNEMETIAWASSQR